MEKVTHHVEAVTPGWNEHEDYGDYNPASDRSLVKGYADIVFDNCFMIEGIRIIQGPAGLFISFPTKKRIDGTHWDIAFPVNAKTRNMIQQAILEKYEKIVPESENRKANVE